MRHVSLVGPRVGCSRNGRVEVCLCFSNFRQLTLLLFPQVFAVRSGGATGVVVKGPDDRNPISFR